MDRREFCRKLSIVGGSIALAPLVNACGPGAAELAKDELLEETQRPGPVATGTAPSESGTTATPNEGQLAGPSPTGTTAPTDAAHPQATHTPSAGSAMATVALVKTGNRAEGVKRAIRLLDRNCFRGNRVLLKPNFNSADPAPGSTHPDVLHTMVNELANLGARSITVGDRSGTGDTRSVMQQIGVLDMAAEMGFDTVVFEELEEDDWTVWQSPDFHWSGGFAVPKILLDAECVVQTCNLKTHRYGGHFTLSLKNSVGFAAKSVGGGHDYMRELHSSRYQRLMIAEINAAYAPDLIVMDGVEAFVTGGPAKGKKVKAGVVLAATDRVAIDAVGVAILRLFGTTKEVSQGRIFDQEQIARAVELGLGVNGPEKIRLLTADTESKDFADQISQVLT